MATLSILSLFIELTVERHFGKSIYPPNADSLMSREIRDYAGPC
jgi:hypothetical protein